MAEDRYVTVAEVKEMLTAENEKRGELIPSLKAAMNTAVDTCPLTKEQADEIIAKISEIIGYSEHVGYALKDLDKDGTPELIIAGMGTDDFSDKMVYDLYTLAGAQPAQLACSAARNRWYLRSDSLLINEGSSGAAYSNVFLFAVKGGGLEAKEGVIVYDGSCYYQNGSCDYEPRSGDRSITMDEYTAKWDGWKSACYLPQLTRIA